MSLTPITKIYNLLGVEVTVTQDTVGYLAEIDNKKDIEIQTQQDTVFITNKNKNTLMLGNIRTTEKTSLILVKQAPAEASNLVITLVDTSNTTTTLVVVAGGAAIATRVTSIVATQIKNAIITEIE